VSGRLPSSWTAENLLTPGLPFYERATWLRPQPDGVPGIFSQHLPALMGVPRGDSAPPRQPACSTGGVTRRGDTPPDRNTPYEKVLSDQAQGRTFAESSAVSPPRRDSAGDSVTHVADGGTAVRCPELPRRPGKLAYEPRTG